VQTFLERFRRDPARVRLERLERLQALTEELSAAQTRDDVVRVVLEHGPAAVEASMLAVYREREPGELEFLYGLGLPEGFAERWRQFHADDRAPVADAYRTGRPTWIPSRAELAERSPACAESFPVEDQAWAALPYVVGGVRGAAALAFRERRAFDDEERNFILAAARQCTTASERARLYDDTNRLAERLRQLHGVATTLSGAATHRDIAAVAFRALGPLGACAAEVHGVEQGTRVALLARHGRASDVPPTAVSIDAPTPAAEVVRSGRAIWLETPEEIAQRYPHLERDRAAREEHAWAVVPLLASGKALGALAVSFPQARRLEADDRTYVRLVAQPCAQALERARLFQDALRSQADADAKAALVSAACGASPAALAVLDREVRFVRVNDAFAREVGISADAHAGLTPGDVFRGVPPDTLLSAFHEVLATGSPADRELEAEVPAAPGVRSRFVASVFPVRVRGELAGIGLLLRRA
jgi:GAF domain-containing protein